MVYATNALVIKPADSLPAMLAVNVLNRYGYSAYKAGKLTAPSALAELDGAMLALTCALPVVFGLLQCWLWSKYTLRESHLVDDESPGESVIFT